METRQPPAETAGSADTPFGVSARVARAVRVGEAVAIAGLIGYAGFLLLQDPGARASLLVDRVLYCALLAIPAALCLSRALLVRRERGAWLCIGLSLTAWTLGETYWAAFLADDPNAPYPSLQDAGSLLWYPLAFAGIALLVRDRARHFNRLTWLDGAIAALTVAALGAGLLLPEVIAALDGTQLANAVTLAYPIGDTMLLGFLFCALVLVGSRLDLSWVLIAASLAVLPIADGIYSYQEATGTYVEGGFIDLLFPLSAVLLGLAPWRAGSRDYAAAVRGWRSTATPGTFALVAGALLLYGYTGRLDGVAVTLAAIALFAAMMRLAVTYRENQRLFERAQRDALTGLGNRSALTLDLQDALAYAEDDPGTLVMLDLNGFKLYNDTFGHPAGDALLARLASAFRSAMAPYGKTYRIGGDEFCALISVPDEQTQRVISAGVAALSESGEAFSIGAARGSVRLGPEASDPLEALRIADQRMYEDKARSRTSARSQAHEVLMRVLRERQPQLGAHVDGVTDLTAAVAARLGIDGEELDVITRAAALHDIGKIAIPDAILDKQQALTDAEWDFISDHTVVGERILREAAALAPVAELVRSTHERWDGAGYPDGLAGEQIPLGARIIFVCDAFQAMTSERPYAGAVSIPEAIDELRRCAGAQFDPSVVEAFCHEVGRLPGSPLPAAAPAIRLTPGD